MGQVSKPGDNKILPRLYRPGRTRTLFLWCARRKEVRRSTCIYVASYGLSQRRLLRVV